MLPICQESADFRVAGQVARRKLSQFQNLVSFALTVLLACLLLGTLLRQPAAAMPDLAVLPGVASDPLSGRALFGHDVIAYYIDGAAVQGRPEYAFRWNGADWLFRNQQNLERFKAAPELFAPALGGHDPLRAISGFPVVADPTQFLIVDQRLWLFRDANSLKQFEKDRSQAAAALAAWTKIRKN